VRCGVVEGGIEAGNRVGARVVWAGKSVVERDAAVGRDSGSGDDGGVSGTRLLTRVGCLKRANELA